MTQNVTRRDFLSNSTRIASSAAAVSVLTGAKTLSSPNEQIQLGLIGCGGIMNHHVRGLVERKSSVIFTSLCDVDPRQMDNISKPIFSFQKTVPKRTSRYEDVLQDRNVDAVIIATPHHWHCPITLRAIEAAKDVYIEKPISHVFQEGRLVIEAALRHNRIVQHGSQMRSSPVTKLAGVFLNEGVIGEVKITKAWNVQKRGTRKVVPDGSPPQGVDYDRWLGPAPERAFNVNRFHGNWRVYQDYGNGDIGDDGIHDIDMARWGLGVETHPVRITSHGSDVYYAGDKKGDREYPDNMMVAYHYADGKVLLYEDRLFTPYGMHGFDSGNAFYGTEGYMIFSRRGYFQIYLGRKEQKGPGVPNAIRGNAGRGYAEHMDNFLECLRSRKPTQSTPDIAHLSCALVHLGEIAYRTGDVLSFDPQKERFRDNPRADRLLTKTYRKGYGLPST